MERANGLYKNFLERGGRGRTGMRENVRDSAEAGVDVSY